MYKLDFVISKVFYEYKRVADTPIRRCQVQIPAWTDCVFYGVKTRLSTLGTGDVPRGSDST